MFIALLLLASCVGAIPTAVLVGRRIGVDVRREGSGNPGATNTWRTAGPLAGLLVLFVDALKGWMVIEFLPQWAVEPTPWTAPAMGLAVVLGHVFSPFLKFHGGKGVATSLGVIAALAPRLLIVPLGLFVIVVVLRRRVHEGSLAAAVALPLVALVYRLTGAGGWPDAALLVLTTTLAVLLVATHRRNLWPG